MSGTGIIAGLLPSIDSILGVRDAVGAVIQPTFIVTRTWYTDTTLATGSSQIGEGVAKDVEIQMLPSPGLKNFSQNLGIREGGSIKSGDIILTSVSKHSYQENDLDGSTGLANVERFYRIGGKLYQVISITEKYVTFDVQLRELSNQARYNT